MQQKLAAKALADVVKAIGAGLAIGGGLLGLCLLLDSAFSDVKP